MFEAIALIYSLGMVWFFVALIRDRYVKLNTRVLIIYTLASLFWPISGLIYILDNRGN